MEKAWIAIQYVRDLQKNKFLTLAVIFILTFAATFVSVTVLSSKTVSAVCVFNSDCPSDQYCNWWSFFACIDCGTYWAGPPYGQCFFGGGTCWSCCGDKFQAVSSSCPAGSYYECGYIHCGTEQTCSVPANVHCYTACGASTECNNYAAGTVVSSTLICDGSCQAKLCTGSQYNCNTANVNGVNYVCTYSSSWAWRTSIPAEYCSDNVDNNCNGLPTYGQSDCIDPSCAGQTRYEAGGVYICCQSDSNCPSGEYCDTSSHTCKLGCTSDAGCPGFDSVTHTKLVCECPSGCGLTGQSYTCKPKPSCSGPGSGDCDSSFCCQAATPGPGGSECKNIGYGVGTSYLCV